MHSTRTVCFPYLCPRCTQCCLLQLRFTTPERQCSREHHWQFSLPCRGLSRSQMGTKRRLHYRQEVQRWQLIATVNKAIGTVEVSMSGQQWDKVSLGSCCDASWCAVSRFAASLVRADRTEKCAFKSFEAVQRCFVRPVSTPLPLR